MTADMHTGNDGYRGRYIIDWAAEMPDDADPLDRHAPTPGSRSIDTWRWVRPRSMKLGK